MSDVPPAVASPPTAQEQVLVWCSLRVLLGLRCSADSLTPARSQAAAAARIECKLKIHQAAYSGNAELIKNHFVADAKSIHQRDGRHCDPFVFFDNAPMNPSVLFSSGHVMPSHSQWKDSTPLF
jgi:hypothetical protein